MVSVLGIDEAGRGPVIGPMVVAGVLLDEKDEKKLLDLGVKDSKALLPSTREALFEKIKRIAKDYRILIVSPAEIDRHVLGSSSNLNLLEAAKSAELIELLVPAKAVIDSPSANTSSFCSSVRSFLKKEFRGEIICRNKADRDFPVVAAASILAKVTRDREIQKLKRRYKVEFGSGYPSDPFTVAFLRENHSKYPFFRKSWASYRNAASKKKQAKLTNF